MYAVTNPATGVVEARYDLHTDEDLARFADEALAAFELWRTSEFAERAALLRAVADLYVERRDELAAIVAREMGKPLPQGRGEIDFVAAIYRHYADHGADYAADEIVPAGRRATAVVRSEGVGPLLGIMPWNYPHYQVARFAAPNLMLGNTVLLKHAPQCPETALAIERIFADAGAAAGLYRNVFADNDQVADLIAHPAVRGVSLTGSERAGAAVAEIAGRHLKKAVLELGGSDPYIVLDDADLSAAVRDAVDARFSNAGQACNSAKRFIVADPLYDRFVESLADAVAGLPVGDPLEETTVVGPLSSAAAVESLRSQLDDATAHGARLVTPTRELPEAGAWFAPAVLVDVDTSMRAYSEELFGPVAVVYRASDDDEAVRIANDSDYGLGAIVRSSDPDRAASVASRLDVGMVSINTVQPSSPALPFGGVKRSGFGRELGSHGMSEFVNRKLVLTAAPQPAAAEPERATA